jgi:hypothetical protein
MAMPSALITVASPSQATGAAARSPVQLPDPFRSRYCTAFTATRFAGQRLSEQRACCVLARLNVFEVLFNCTQMVARAPRLVKSLDVSLAIL